MMARALAGAGAKRVYILGRRQATLEAAVTAHPSICPLVCDVTSKNSLQAAVDTISNEFGYINLIIANSGVLGPLKSFDPEMTIQGLRRNLFDMESFTDVLHVNVTGAYFTILRFWNFSMRVIRTP